MKLNYQYTCDSCGLKYQVVDTVEVINAFAWSKSDGERDKACKSCIDSKLKKEDN